MEMSVGTESGVTAEEQATEVIAVQVAAAVQSTNVLTGVDLALEECLGLIRADSFTDANLARVKALLSEHQDLKQKSFGQDERSLLHEAVRFGREELTRDLVREGFFEVDIEDKDGVTPLHRAVLEGNQKMARLLVDDLGASVNARNGKGTPLHCAVHRSDAAMVRLLKERGADVNAENEQGDRPLHWAATAEKSEEMARLLVELRAEPGAKNKLHQTALHFAAAQGRLGMAQYLVKECGVDIRAQDTNQCMAAHLAENYGKQDVLTFLVGEITANVHVGGAEDVRRNRFSRRVSDILKDGERKTGSFVDEVVAKEETAESREPSP